MANTFIKISTVTVGSGGAATIDFTSIPQTYTDLKIVISSRDAYAGPSDGIKMFFNSSTTSYSYAYAQGTGSATGAGLGSGDAWGQGNTGNAATSTASVFGNIEIYIANYTSANSKSFLSDGIIENNAAVGSLLLYANLWSNSAAITSIQLTPYQPVNFVQYTTATLYGIKSS
jgi:hypothetical protein